MKQKPRAKTINFRDTPFGRRLLEREFAKLSRLAPESIKTARARVVRDGFVSPLVENEIKNIEISRVVDKLDELNVSMPKFLLRFAAMRIERAYLEVLDHISNYVNR